MNCSFFLKLTEYVPCGDYIQFNFIGKHTKMVNIQNLQQFLRNLALAN